MRRFILLTLIGGLAAIGGHSVISFGLHPERLAPLAVLLQGSAALVIGAALFSTGLLGLADGYEKIAARVDELLRQKQPGTGDENPPVADQDDLLQKNLEFWRGYARTGIGLGLFLTGLLVVTAAMARMSPAMFTVGVGTTTIILVLTAATVSIRGLSRVRSAHVGVDVSARQLSRRPDRRADRRADGRSEEGVRPTRRRRTPRVTLFPRAGVGSRRLDHARPPAPVS